MKRVMLDLFCGRLRWSKAFLARGWECIGIDLIEPSQAIRGTDENFSYLQMDAMNIGERFIFEGNFDFICASSPCEEFSVHGMKHFHPNPKYPENGIRLFNHTRELCEASGVPYVMENVRAAQQFVGKAVHHCGPWYLWGTGVPPLLHRGIVKPFRGASGSYMAKCPPDFDKKKWRMLWQKDFERQVGSRKDCPALAATIPPELANCVADYAERLLEQKESA